MNCKNARQRWHRRLDDGESAAELDGHLASCESCREYVADMVRLVGLLDELREDTESLTPTVAQIRPHAAPRPRSGWAMPKARNLLRIAAAVLLAVSAGLWYGLERRVTVVDQNIISAIPAMGITLRAQSRDRFIAVAAPSDEPNVQTFWLYPTVAVAEIRDRS